MTVSPTARWAAWQDRLAAAGAVVFDAVGAVSELDVHCLDPLRHPIFHRVLIDQCEAHQHEQEEKRRTCKNKAVRAPTAPRQQRPSRASSKEETD